MKLTAIWALVRNDVRIYSTDRRAVIVGVFVPILIAAFFGFGGIAAGAAGIAKILFVIFLIGAVVAFLMNSSRRI